MTASKKGKHVYITSDESVASLVRQSFEIDHDQASVNMAKVVKQIRNDIYEQEERDDNSSSDTASIPLSLQTAKMAANL